LVAFAFVAAFAGTAVGSVDDTFAVDSTFVAVGSVGDTFAVDSTFVAAVGSVDDTFAVDSTFVAGIVIESIGTLDVAARCARVRVGLG
jgi:hypothetical protein